MAYIRLASSYTVSQYLVELEADFMRFSIPLLQAICLSLEFDTSVPDLAGLTGEASLLTSSSEALAERSLIFLPPTTT